MRDAGSESVSRLAATGQLLNEADPTEMAS